MRIFNYGSSINFIDENDVFLGYSIGSSCSESANYKLFYDRKGKKEVYYENEDELNTILEGYSFDTEFMVDFHDNKNTGANIALVRCLNEEGSYIYIALSNRHNGYYSQGFCMEKLDMSGYTEDYEASFGYFCNEEAPRIQYFLGASI